MANRFYIIPREDTLWNFLSISWNTNLTLISQCIIILNSNYTVFLRFHEVFQWKKSLGKDTLWNFSFRVFQEIHFQGHFMKHEILSWHTFTLVSKFHCVRFSTIKKNCVYWEKIYLLPFNSIK